MLFKIFNRCFLAALVATVVIGCGKDDVAVPQAAPATEQVSPEQAAALCANKG